MSTLDDLLIFAVTIEPLVVGTQQRDRKIELNLEIRVQNLRTTNSVPPGLVDFVCELEVQGEKISSLESIETIYSYISSMVKKSAALSDFKNAKISMTDGGADYDLTVMLKNAKDYVAQKKKLEKEKQKVLSASSNVVLVKEITADGDNIKIKKKSKTLSEGELDGMSRLLARLKDTVIRQLKESESLLASKGLKIK